MAKASSRQPAKKYDLNEILHQAYRFYVAVDRLHDVRSRQPQSAEMLIAPLIVLTAFTSELLMKALILGEKGKMEWGHDLDALFNKLPAATQSAIETEWATEMAANELQTKQLDILAGETVPRDLRQAIKVSASAFQWVRYPFDFPGTRAYITYLPRALHRALVVLHPDWPALKEVVQ